MLILNSFYWLERWLNVSFWHLGNFFKLTEKDLHERFIFIGISIRHAVQFSVIQFCWLQIKPIILGNLVYHWCFARSPYPKGVVQQCKVTLNHRTSYLIDFLTPSTPTLFWTKPDMVWLKKKFDKLAKEFVTDIIL